MADNRLSEEQLTLIKNPNKLLEEEWDQYQSVHSEWARHKTDKNFTEADRYRDKLFQWDRRLDTDPNTWHPHFEEALHAMLRMKTRMEKYDVEIYPFTNGFKMPE